ncbi:MAG: monovalent cation/H+ antiporter complex subunit F [Chloroflexota bacterium]
MSPWLAAAVALLLGFLPCGWVIYRRTALDGLVALQAASVLAVTVLLLLSQGYGLPSFADLGLILMVLSIGGGLVYARFLERWV